MSEWAKDVFFKFPLESGDWVVFSLVCDASSCPKDQIQLSGPRSKGKQLGAARYHRVSGIKTGRHSLGARCPGVGVGRQEGRSLWELRKLFWMQQAQAPGELQEAAGWQAQAFQ